MTEWSYTVRIWSIRKRPYRKPFQLRWQVGTRPHSESFLTRGLAESRRAQFVTAAREGEPWDVDSGLPKSMVQKAKDISWYQHARNYVELKWNHSPASTRRNLAEAMATVALALVKDTKGMSDHKAVRRALYTWGFNVHRWKEEPPADVAELLTWVERKSVATSALSDRMLVRKALDACSRRLDGKTSSGSVIARKRAIFHQALGFAVDAELLAENPLATVKWKAPERVEEQVDPECVPDPERAAALLAAVRKQGSRGKHLEAFFGCIYYSAARPGELVGLQLQDCDLPRRGWGVLRLRESRARSGSSWTDTGEAHDRRGLKHRARKTVRYVPIPPELVAMLRWHVTLYGAHADGRLFRTARGGMVQESGYGEVWANAREDALTPAERTTKLAKRPYDLRHAAVSTWLSSGVEPQLVAQRAGHSTGVLFRVYAKFLKGGDEAANAKISARLRERSAPLPKSV
ncbi:tyrosine-type recombinase/integrase [Streptomyces solicathayae]|uniref:Tyrosine-type recombinase/integrase n=1 Tax=Streptomyces solicathayae TaxID=3081768 RepID=A0ABZ0LTC2_9ACTN|nr:tyrosine-type recombinase/integrase [Streptomyces sp. HUAS YS2]WOX22728.1 tyrosine-type recombinase/integrase [Streptomyces sp. HUAS YS2]